MESHILSPTIKSTRGSRWLARWCRVLIHVPTSGCLDDRFFVSFRLFEDTETTMTDLTAP